MHVIGGVPCFDLVSVNLGVIGGFGYLLYTTPAYRSDYRIIGGAAAGTLLLFGAEGAMAESYLQTPEGQREKKRVEEEGSALYRHTKEIVLRPGVFGGLLGLGQSGFGLEYNQISRIADPSLASLVNVGILGGLGYTAYSHWDEPVWDRRYVAGITAGTLALLSGQG